MAVKAEQTHRLYARFRADIEVTEYRLKCGNRVFTILDKENIGENNREMVLLLKETTV
jgi:head-tail adaptor